MSTADMEFTFTIPQSRSPPALDVSMKINHDDDEEPSPTIQQRGRTSSYQILESPMKSDDRGGLIQVRSIETVSQIECYICQHNTDSKDLIRICHCEEQYEYIHKRCLVNDLNNTINHTKHETRDVTSYSCARCKQHYPIKVRSRIDIFLAWKERKQDLRIKFLFLAAQLFMLIILVQQAKERATEDTLVGWYLTIAAIGLWALITLMMTCRNCVFTYWTFVDRFSREPFQHVMISTWHWRARL